MFIKTRIDTVGENKIARVFVKSSSIQAFPCGRRRSTEISTAGSTSTSDKYRIPFDPEARLNTEANNLKHSGLNGFTQTYVKSYNKSYIDGDNEFKDGVFLFSLAGYLFSIKLTGDYYDSPNNFGGSIISCIARALYDSANSNQDIDTFTANFAEDNSKIYANIRINALKNIFFAQYS